MKFEWDEEKNLKNIEKHGFDFGDAEELFIDRFFFREPNCERRKRLLSRVMSMPMSSNGFADGEMVGSSP